MERVQRTIMVYDKCECGRVLHSMVEGQRGTCSTCWVNNMPKDTKNALNQLIASAFKPTSEAVRSTLVADALDKLRRDDKP